MTGTEGLNSQEINGAVDRPEGVPAPDEVFEMFERGEFDVRPVEASATEEQPLLKVIQQDVLNWARDRAQAIRAAGKKGTWDGRRDVRGRTFADREKPHFVGRYTGKCAVTPHLLKTEYGEPDARALLQ